MMTAYVSALFFFQAEDGIRDTSVTGVQTCALPISSSSASPTIRRSRRARAARHRARAARRSGARWPPAARPRSEERLVGKEWRSRWAQERAKQEVRIATLMTCDYENGGLEDMVTAR